MLTYYTKDAVSSKQRSKVYFCAHPNDLNMLKPIADELLAKQSGMSIWYYDDPRNDRKNREHESELKLMQMFVVPVTRRFLTEPNAGLDDFKFAIAHHIPVLPLTQEAELRDLFNDVCGRYTLLDKYKNDPTSIPYEFKLDRFLKAHLANNKLIDKLYNAFCAYLFVSYRQQDRDAVHEMMKHIHQKESLRDVAIWYDEFLMAGEKFDDIIRKAIDDCHLVVFAVAPSFLEEGNYIQKPDGEFPYACSKNKPLIPIEIKKTDQAKLKELYKDIPNCISIEELPSYLEAQLNKLNLVHKPTDAFHTYLLGLAYLNGIHVETNKELGIKYIESSYENDKSVAELLPEAAKTIAEIYFWGNGVDPSISKAASYQREYCTYLIEVVRQNDSIAFYEELVREIYWLGELCMKPIDGKDPGSTTSISRGVAADAYNVACQCCRKIIETDPENMEFLSYYILSNAALSNILFYNAVRSRNPIYRKENFEWAEESSRKWIELLEKNISALNRYSLKGIKFSLADAYAWLADKLPYMVSDLGKTKIKEAIELYKKATLAETVEKNKLSCAVQLSSHYFQIAKLHQSCQQINQAVEYYQKVIDIYKTFPKKDFYYEVVENRMVESLGSIAEIMAETGKIEAAMSYYKELSKYRLIDWYDD